MQPSPKNPEPSGTRCTPAVECRPLGQSARSRTTASTDVAPRPARATTYPHLSRLTAAGRLIGDESREVRQALMREFKRAGKVGLPILRSATRSPEARVRSHGRHLLESVRRADVMRRLLRLSSADHLDLESAFYLLANLERPDFDSRPYRKALDAMGAEVLKRTSHLKDDLQRCKVLANYLGNELGYTGDLESYTHPDNIYFHRVIERKQGLPLSLCALYSFVARRASLQTGIIPLPGHVMLRLYGAFQNLIVDPFHGGEARSQEDLISYLRQHGLRFNPVWMHDASPKLLFARQVANLQNSLRSIGLIRRAHELDLLLERLGR